MNHSINAEVTSHTVPADSLVSAVKVTIQADHGGITLYQGKDCIWLDERQFVEIKTFLETNNRL